MARRERLGSTHSYASVLALIALTFAALFALPDENWSLSVVVLIECAMLAVALWASGLGRWRPASALVALGGTVAVVELLRGGATLEGVVWLLLLGLGVATIVVIGLGVVDQREINRQSISGAVCVYLLVGIVFTFVYGALAELGSADFFVQGTDGTTSERVYFSYVTVATLGYGDFTPAGSLGRALAVSEALLGQLYLVTIVALLVGRFGQKRPEAGPLRG